MCQTTRSVRATAKLVGGQRVCCVCSSKLYGRIDKAFCDYKCKNEYHRENRLRSGTASSPFITKINRNFHILCYLMPPDANKICVSRQELVRLGFQFDVSSAAVENRYGVIRHVYEYSWYRAKGQNIIITRDPDFTPVSPHVYRRWLQELFPKLAATRT